MVDTYLNKEWFNLSSKYCDYHKSECILNELKLAYNNHKRSYHNLTHIENMLVLADKEKQHLIDYDAIRFAIWFHDAVYRVTNSNNEVKSAEMARCTLIEMGVPTETRKITIQLILASSNHTSKEEGSNYDFNFFLDADLWILGQPWNDYTTYAKNIRKEYSIYPNTIYNKGRKKVLNSYLQRSIIYKTNWFRKNYEQQARKNITKEIEQL
ncbi:MAG: hypothetical protein COB15_01440 [Flavobacteriales bacterium]|nr:MAG: hypothetical protein COB15_01440 [Flavobacteriales bacterium]